MAWPFVATMLCASLLGIGLAYCARTLLPAWGIDGGIASFLPSGVVCSSENPSKSPETASADE